MQTGFNYRVLVVDDEENIRITCSAILGQKGYEVRTAEDGFADGVELRRSLPDVIISDLRMPNMNGFEFLSVVRQRFPGISVIAISGEFIGSAPNGLLADAFLNKGDYTPEELCQKISCLLEQAPLRASVVKPDKAPIWVPKDNSGYIIVTCPQCLRSLFYSIRPHRCTSNHGVHILYFSGRLRDRHKKHRIAWQHPAAKKRLTGCLTCKSPVLQRQPMPRNRAGERRLRRRDHQCQVLHGPSACAIPSIPRA